MHSAARGRRLMVFLLWTGLGLFSTLEMHIESSVSSRSTSSWGEEVSLQLAFTTLWALLTPVIVSLGDRFRVDQPPFWKPIGIHLILSALTAVFVKTTWLLIVWYFRNVPFTAKRYALNLVYNFDYDLLLYWVVLVMSYAVEYYRRYQQSSLDAAKLNGELAQAQLRWLKAQLHPHFLFNALNTISSLVHEDADSAQRMIARLSDLLRLSLRDGGVQEVPLRQELEHVGLYLEIERARFESRLVVDHAIDEDTLDVLVPSLVLQPLVENAIRHGIGNRAAGGSVKISSSRHGSRLALSVSDDGVGLRATAVHPTKEGVGLSTVRGRLERLYGRSQSLLLRNLPGGGVEALMSIPIQTQIAPSEEVLHEEV